jgi:hypothetical protein
VYCKGDSTKLAAQFEKDPSQEWCGLILGMTEITVVVDTGVF